MPYDASIGVKLRNIDVDSIGTLPLGTGRNLEAASTVGFPTAAECYAATVIISAVGVVIRSIDVSFRIPFHDDSVEGATEGNRFSVDRVTGHKRPGKSSIHCEVTVGLIDSDLADV